MVEVLTKLGYHPHFCLPLPCLRNFTTLNWPPSSSACLRAKSLYLILIHRTLLFLSHHAQDHRPRYSLESPRSQTQILLRALGEAGKNSSHLCHLPPLQCWPHLLLKILAAFTEFYFKTGGWLLIPSRFCLIVFLHTTLPPFSWYFPPCRCLRYQSESWSLDHNEAILICWRELSSSLPQGTAVPIVSQKTNQDNKMVSL